MHPLTVKALKQAAARGAVLTLDAHFDAVTTLDAAARGTAEGAVCDAGCDPVDRPMIIGNTEPRLRISGRAAVLYSPSYAALEWIQDAAVWFDRSPALALMAGCWALAHARDPMAIRMASSPDTARRAVRRWARSLNCPVRDLATAYTALMARHAKPSRADGDTPAESSQERGGSMLRHALLRLQAEFGQDDEYWLFGPSDRIEEALEALRRKDDAEEAALAKAEKRAAARNPESAAVRAFRRWQLAKDAFLKAIGLGNE